MNMRNFYKGFCEKCRRDNKTLRQNFNGEFICIDCWDNYGDTNYKELLK